MTRIRITQFRFFLVCILSSAIIQLLMTPLLLAQATAWTGGIQGTILDPSGGVIPNAKVQITGKSTGQKLAPPLTAAGIYDSGPLTPGDYLVRVEAEGFKTVEETLTVQVGVVSSGNVTLQVGTSATVVTVDASSVRVNTEQATLFGILTTQQIENLPINGRNSLDLAQLEPGVQIQDGGNFDPTKLGFSSISFGGRFGRAARVEADGLDVSDEGVGTTTTNIPLSALQEFQVSQSMLDLSTELTSTGAVNMVTRSGTNDYHGQAFYTIRDHNLAAALPGPPAPFQRHQFGGNFGGPLLKDRLLLFAAGEGTKQDLFAPVPLEEPFQAFSGGFNSPYREGNLVGRLDWQANSNLKMFYRFSYFQSRAVSTYGFGAVSYSPFNSRNWNRAHAVGADFTTGKFIHSLRLGYLNYVNNITDAVRGSGLPLADFPLSLSIGSLSTGPNFLASQSTTQQGSLQLKYDSSRIRGSHILRYGVTYNRVLGYGFAAFCAMAPIAQTSLGVSEEAFASTNPFGPGGGGNPLNYPVELVFVGNGLGYFSEIPTFGYPAGGFGPDHRLGIYVGDTWKIRANFTLSYGLRYVRDTGRSDSDLPPIPELNAVLPGFGNRIHQPNSDFAPQLGVAYDPWKSGKTVIRAGLGLFYENSVWNNVMFDRPARLSTGAFGTVSVACNAGVPQMVVFADGSTRPPPAGACSTAEGAPVPLGQAAPLLEQFSQEFQQVAASVGTNAVNPNYVPSLIAAGFPLGGSWSTLYDPQYQSPRSVEMNLGVQRELWKGSVVSVDFLRNVGTHYLLGMDVNHAGDARYLNREAARLAISATNGAFNCGTGSDAASIPCAIQAGATIGDYAGHGLTSPADFGVANCDLTLGFPCAFAGQDRAMGSAYFLQPIGRSVYNALHVKLVHNSTLPWRFLHHLNLQISYSLSRFVNAGVQGAGTAGAANSNDQDMGSVKNALDNAQPFRYMGPSTLDRTHQFSLGGIMQLPQSIQVSFVSHLWSALPQALMVPSTNLGPGEIFRTDLTGDGTVQDPLPGTRVGSFGRDISLGDLNGVISRFNSNVAGSLTPAGRALVAAGLFSEDQLKALGAVVPSIPLAPADQAGLAGLRALDFKLSWIRKFHETITLEPGFSVFNLFNFANYDLPQSVLSGVLTGTVGTLNGTNYGQKSAQRVGVGSGVFALGAPRVLEFGLKFSF